MLLEFQDTLLSYLYCWNMLAQNGSKKIALMNKIRQLQLRSRTIETPILWLGHDLNHPIRAWKHLLETPGLIISGYQILSKRSYKERATTIGLKKMLEFNGPVFVDSGGFAFQRSGIANITVDELRSLYQELKPDIAAVLDLPMSFEASAHDNNLRWQETLANIECMIEDQDLYGYHLAPVFHAYDLISLDERLDQFEAILRSPHIVCIGSLVPLLKSSYIKDTFKNRKPGLSALQMRWEHLARVVLTVRNRFPDAILHAFGVGSLSTIYFLFLLGVDSVDSVSWRVKAAFGEILLPGTTNRTLSPKRAKIRRRIPLRKSDRILLNQCMCPVCRERSEKERLCALADDFVSRAIHNAYILINEVTNIRKSIKEQNLFDIIRKKVNVLSEKYSLLYIAILDLIKDYQHDSSL